MTVENSLAALSTVDVCQRCRDETANYRRREAHDDRYCFEMIRRAVAERDEHCWQELYAIYHDQVLSWCRRRQREHGRSRRDGRTGVGEVLAQLHPRKACDVLRHCRCLKVPAALRLQRRDRRQPRSCSCIFARSVPDRGRPAPAQRLRKRRLRRHRTPRCGRRSGGISGTSGNGIDVPDVPDRSEVRRGALGEADLFPRLVMCTA